MSTGRSEEEREAARQARIARRIGIGDPEPLDLEPLEPPEPPPPRQGRPPRTRRPPRAPRASRRRRRAGALVVLGAAIVIVAVAGWFLVSLFQPGQGDGTGRVGVQVPRGSTPREIGDLLATRGVVDSGFFFSLRTSLSGKRSELRSGSFALKRDMSYAAALDVLTTVPKAAPTVALTIPEGRSIREEIPKLAGADVRGSYARAAADHRLIDPSRYGAPGGRRNAEGFLFPATYELRRPPQARALVIKQLAAFRANLANVDLRFAHRKNLTVYDVLIIASMVEREAQVAAERPLIASVIYNRLKQHIPLGIDATTRYALDDWTRPLITRDFPRSGAYDTRHRQGLPPTPIGSPGLSSIRAAAHPARTRFLFYVVQPGRCGHHAFSTTAAQFNRDVARYNAARDANGGRSPTTCR